MKKRKRLIFIFVFSIILVVSCRAKDGPALVITGVKDTSFSQSELEALSLVDSQYTNKDGDTTIFTGVSINEILSFAEIGVYSKITIIASDGYSAEMSYEELSDCHDCILTKNETKGWSAVMPGFPGKLQVKDVVEFNIQ